MSFKISIIMATFNSEMKIESAIRSLISQSFQNWELCVQDNCSKDKTVEIIRSFNDTRIDIIVERDLGIYDAINKAITRVSGDILGFLHSDDKFFSNHVLEVISKEFLHKNINGLYSDLIYVDPIKSLNVIRVWKPGIFKLKRLKYGWMPPHPTLFLTAQTQHDVGQYNISYRVSGDYDFILRLLSIPNIKILYINKVTVKMSIGGASSGGMNSFITKTKEDYNIIKNYKLLGFITLILKKIIKIKQFLIRI